MLSGLYQRAILLSLVLSITSFAAFAQTAPPRIFFTDLTSGPKTGGENNNGAFVTIYGNNFGASPSVTVGGGAATIKLQPSSYLWYQKMTIQLGPNAQTGNIVVSNAVGTSNGVPFTVRSGNIFFVGTQPGDMSNLLTCKGNLAAGDICYVRSGMNITGTENYNATVVLDSPGTASAPKALLTYPGAAVTVGSVSQARGFYACSGLSGCSNGSFWVIGGFTVRATEALLMVGVSNNRLVGMDVSCPQGNGSTGCFESETFTNGTILGVHMHDSGVAGADKTYHSIYFGTNSNHSEVGWSQVHDGGACRGIQFHSTGGADMFDLHVHDNRIYNIVCNGINFAAVAPANGTVEAYNNVVYNAGIGPDPAGGSSDYSCIMIASFSATAGAVQVYNNTFYGCGTRGGSDAGMVTLWRAAKLTNNIIYSTGAPYFTNSTSGNVSSMLTGSNNIWFGAGSGPSQTTGNISVNPLLANTSTFNFHLQAGSPAVGAGVGTSLASDMDGLLRPASAPDIGAYQFTNAIVTGPQPPTNLTVVVQ